VMAPVRPPLHYRRAGPDDVAALMRIERGPGYDALVSRSDASEHARWIAAADCAVWVVHDDDAPAGFALLTDLQDPHGGAYLKRIAVARPGAGIGAALMGHVLAFAFDDLGAPRLHLNVLADNHRARAAYRRAGLREEGLLKASYLMPDGSRTDRITMAILAEEWRGYRGLAGASEG